MAWPPAADLKLEIAWGDTPNTYPRTWTDVTAYLKGPYWKLSTQRGRSFVLDQVQAGRMTVTLDNADGRFTPDNSAGAYYPDVVTDVPIRAHTNITVTDSFNRANGPVGAADTGQTWLYAESSAMWVIDSNQLHRYGGVSGEGAVLQNIGASDIELQFEYVAVRDRQGAVWRSNGGVGGNAFVLDAAGDPTRYRIRRWTAAGTYTVLDDDIGVTPASFDTIRIVARGPTHQIYVNGTLAVTFVDDTNLLEQYHGLKAFQPGSFPPDTRFDNFSLIAPGPLFEGYIQSYDPEWPEDDMEGICTIEAVDGIGPLAGDALVTPGYSDAFNRPDGTPITRADTGQTWNVDAGTWETWDSAAQCVRLAGLRETFVPGTRATYVGDTSLATDHTNRLGTAPTLQTWSAVTGGNWLIYGPGAGEDYAHVADWLNYRSFYEDPATNADAAGFYRVGISPPGSVFSYTARLTLGNTATTDNTGSMMGLFFFGSGTSYWAFLLEDRTPSGLLGYGCTLVKVDAGTETFYRTIADIYPSSPDNPAYLSAFYFGGLPFSTTTVDATVSLVGGNIRVDITPIQAGTTPRPDLTVRVADKPAGGFLPGTGCGLIHNGVSRLDQTDHTTKVNQYRWEDISASGRGVLWMETSLADAIVQVRIKMADSRLAYNYDFSGKGLVFRYSDANNFWFTFISSDGAGSPFYLRLYKIVAGVTSLVDYHHFGTYSDAIANGDYSLDLTANILRVTLSGNEIQVEWHGVTRITTADSFNQTATKHGLYHGNAIFSSDIQDEEDWPGDLIVRNHDDFRLGRALDTQYTGERVGVLLDLVGWPEDLRDIATGTVLIAPREVDVLAPDFNLSILGEIQYAVDAELGLFYIRADGTAVFEDRNTRLDTAHTTSHGTFGNGGGSDVPVTVFRPRMDNTRIANVVGVERVAFDVDEVQTITLTGATGGTWTATYRGYYETAAIDFDATAAEVQAAFNGLFPIVVGDVSVTGSDGGPYAIRFRENLGNQDIDLLQVDGSALTGTSPTIEVVETTKGGSADDKPATAMAQDAASISSHRRRPLSKQTQLTTEEDAQTLANLLLNRWKSDHMRIEALALEWSLPERYAQARKREISDLIEAEYTPPSSPAYSVAQASFIEGIAHEISQERAVTTWSVSPAALSASYWIIGHAVFGVVGVTTIPA